MNLYSITALASLDFSVVATLCNLSRGILFTNLKRYVQIWIPALRLTLMCRCNNFALD